MAKVMYCVGYPYPKEACGILSDILRVLVLIEVRNPGWRLQYFGEFLGWTRPILDDLDVIDAPLRRSHMCNTWEFVRYDCRPRMKLLTRESSAEVEGYDVAMAVCAHHLDDL